MRSIKKLVHDSSLSIRELSMDRDIEDHISHEKQKLDELILSIEKHNSDMFAMLEQIQKDNAEMMEILTGMVGKT